MNEEFLINSYLKKLSKNNPSSLNLNDDVFFDKKNKLILSIDTYNENTHFFNFKNPHLVIKKIIRSSISDLICKGVKPKYFFLSGSGNKNHFNKKNLKLISKAISDEQKFFNIKLSGGDMTNSKKSSFTITSVGFSKNIIKRNNTKNNDDIYITGNLGDSFVGLNILKKKIHLDKKYRNYFINKYYLPNLPIGLIKFINKFANSSIDVSDGLFADMHKLINKQKISFILFADLIPISKNLKIYLKNVKKSHLNFISKGDDYQIIFTSNKRNRKYIKRLAKRINQKITLIGSITNKSGHNKIISNGKQLKSKNYEGYFHKF